MFRYETITIPVTKVTGLQLEHANGRYKLVKHEYVGKEPEPTFIYDLVSDICRRFEIIPFLALNRCDDEVGGMTHIQRMFVLRESFMNAIIGTQASTQPTEVASHEGHKSNVYEVNVHTGMYEHPTTKRILLGKVRGRDGEYRKTCGALASLIHHFEADTEPPVYTHRGESGIEIKVPVATPDKKDFNFIGKLYFDLEQYKPEVLRAMAEAGDDPDERLSAGMNLLVQRNLEHQVANQIQILRHNGHIDGKVLVVGTTSFNKYKYADTLTLGSVHLIEDGKVIDISKQNF